ncbi:MAG: MBL fold metallo-hydrolase [Eubacteriales bacterium]
MKKHMVPVLWAAILLLAGCSGTKGTEDGTSGVSSAVQAAVTTAATTSSETTKLMETTAASAAPAELVLPLTENTTGKVQIQTVSGSLSYKYNSYIITSAEGESVVVDPTSMPSVDIVDINPAAIISTHAHDDHVSKKFTDAYDCQKIMYTKADIKTKDFHIYTVPSSHADDMILDNATNYIAVFEVDGLRIAHMGDIGQTVLTDDQLAAIGEIDIAFMQFENSYSNMSLKNEKGFNLIEQLNPKIIIPTHYTEAAIPVLTEKYGAVQEFDNVLAVSREDLPEKALTVYHITNTHKYS